MLYGDELYHLRRLRKNYLPIVLAFSPVLRVAASVT